MKINNILVIGKRRNGVYLVRNVQLLKLKVYY